MKLNIRALELNGISFSDLLGLYDEGEIKSIQETIEEEDGYNDEYLSFYKDDDSGDVDVSLMTDSQMDRYGAWEIIDHINTMKICENDPFILIVKDSWEADNSKEEDVGYTTFEVFHHEDEPLSLKGGEYDKKTIMNNEELKEFSELEENEDIMYNTKYQDFYFVRTSEYNAKEWLEKWLSENYGHNKSRKNTSPAEEFLNKDTLARQLTELMLTKEKLIQEEKYELLKELQKIYDKIKADYDKL